jgi:hypothetical protein
VPTETLDPTISPVFGDLTAKVTEAIDREVARLRELGVPVMVDLGNGVEEDLGTAETAALSSSR